MAKSTKKSAKRKPAKKAAKRKTTSKQTARRKSAKAPTKKTTARRVTSSKKKGAATKAKAKKGCTPPYCEMYCNDNVWYLIGENHPTNVYCPSSLPSHSGPRKTAKGCTNGTTWCSTPTNAAPPTPATPLELKENTGIYEPDGRTLYLTRGKYDLKHFCPHKLTLNKLWKHQPELAAVLAPALKNKNIHIKSVTVKAFKR